MEPTSTPREADRPAFSALARYDQAVANFAPTGAFWLEIASALRTEAATYLQYSDQRRKRLDRAVDCEARAGRSVS